jgi:hypothetical protein
MRKSAGAPRNPDSGDARSFDCRSRRLRGRQGRRAIDPVRGAGLLSRLIPGTPQLSTAPSGCHLPGGGVEPGNLRALHPDMEPTNALKSYFCTSLSSMKRIIQIKDC